MRPERVETSSLTSFSASSSLHAQQKSLAAMIASALSALRARARSFDMIFDFLPGRFTLTDLQRVWETVTGEPVQSANFRRKTADLVTETDAVTEGAGHRPARLYERRQTKPTETRTAQKGE